MFVFLVLEFILYETKINFLYMCKMEIIYLKIQTIKPNSAFYVVDANRHDDILYVYSLLNNNFLIFLLRYYNYTKERYISVNFDDNFK